MRNSRHPALGLGRNGDWLAPHDHRCTALPARRFRMMSNKRLPRFAGLRTEKAGTMLSLNGKRWKAACRILKNFNRSSVSPCRLRRRNPSSPNTALTSRCISEKRDQRTDNDYGRRGAWDCLARRCWILRVRDLKCARKKRPTRPGKVRVGLYQIQFSSG